MFSNVDQSPNPATIWALKNLEHKFKKNFFGIIGRVGGLDRKNFRKLLLKLLWFTMNLIVVNFLTILKADDSIHFLTLQ